MSSYQILLPNGIKGSVFISLGNISIEFPTFTMTGTIKSYILELRDSTGKEIKFELHKDPKGNWWDSWFLTYNPDVDKTLISSAKNEIDKMGI